jgi:predicted regulator of Ras-like GTPase activity (Roadblock/LC7/MglB family)
VDAAQALADLTEISSQIVHAAIVGADGAVLASTLADADRSARFAADVSRLVEEADALRARHGLQGFSQLEVATLGGSVFVVRRPDGRGHIAAVTRPEPTVGLVFYDLKHALRSIDEKPRARTRKKADASA